MWDITYINILCVYIYTAWFLFPTEKARTSTLDHFSWSASEAGWMMDPQQVFFRLISPNLGWLEITAGLITHVTPIHHPDQLDALAGTALAGHALGSDGVAASALAEHALGDEGCTVLPYEARFGEGWGQNGTNRSAPVELVNSVLVEKPMVSDKFHWLIHDD